MKIAFVWKWWSWKSTISTLFTQFLLEKNIDVIWFDADININYFSNLKLNTKEWFALSDNKNVEKIRKYLIWNNEKIKSTEHFVKTTPPTNKSNFLEYNKDNYIIKNFWQKKWSWYFFYVWKYEKDAIWTSCYHNNLSIFENILSHTRLQDNQYLVADMCAWTDAFSNSLHAQFNRIILIINPSQESIKVAKDFIELAKNARTIDNIYIIINNYEEIEEINYIEKEIWQKANIYLQKNKEIKRKSLIWEEINTNEKIFKESFEKIIKEKSKYNDECIIENLKSLHIRYASQAYVIRRVWDITLQAK